MPSETLVHISLVVGTALSGLSLSLLVAALLLRMGYARRERETEAALRVWFPYFLNAAVGKSSRLPPSGADAVAVMTLWLDFMESVGGAVRDRVRDSIVHTSLPEVAGNLLRSHVPSERMLAIAVVGHLRAREHWDRLLRILDRGGIPSLLAARALIQIDPRAALPTVVTKMRRREDWPLPTVASMLLEEDPSLVGEVLARELRQAEEDREPKCQAYILDLLATVGGPAAHEPLNRCLESDRPHGVIQAALRAAQRPGNTADPSVVRPFLDHTDAAVRAEAARTLGRLGGPGDDTLLATKLSDPDAWVRYCAAQAISYLPWITLDDLRRLRDETEDPRAKAVLGQVASEEVSAAATLEAATADRQRLPVKFLRDFIGHPNWKIRLQAVERLSLTSREGQKTLVRLLQDERWWTQYEAARRLVQRPFVDMRSLRQLLEVEGDPRSESVLALVAQEHAA